MPRRRRRGLERLHLLEPDYARPIYEVPKETSRKILDLLAFLYGKGIAEECLPKVERLMKVYYAHKTPELVAFEESFNPTERFNEEDSMLITYGDLIQTPGESPLDTLVEFCETHLKRTINTLHILPFFPYSSDRGFAIVDFEQVDPRLGNWDDIDDLKKSFRLMFDGVFNHVSSKSRWFQEFRDGNPNYSDFFIVFSTRNYIPDDYLNLITRPRRSSLLTDYTTLNGRKWVWTTFSPDQIDLNFRNPRVLLKALQILLSYVRRGADIIRLDAVTYLWAELGTTCAHLAQTHAIIKLFRVVLDAVAPVAALITETNVPHELNVAYFGDSTDEAHMVYNFALPPLVLHAFQTENASRLTQWAATIRHISPTATYFNFLDSHDGVGVTPVRGILTPEDIEMMALRVVEHGGFISYKDNGDGTTSPYELNVTWYSALNREDADETDDFQIKRFLASRSIALVMMGIPGIYLHSLLGSRNAADAVLSDEQTRSINRKVIDSESLKAALRDPRTTTHNVSRRFRRLLATRKKELAFHPNAPQRVLFLDDSVFALVRTSLDGAGQVLCITNVTSRNVELRLSPDTAALRCGKLNDILSGKAFEGADGVFRLRMEPYEFLWLKSELSV
ncbi:alpha-amylase family glycosyl hydrolase [Thermodesulfobacteriota bacterium]